MHSLVILWDISHLLGVLPGRRKHTEWTIGGGMPYTRKRCQGNHLLLPLGNAHSQLPFAVRVSEMMYDIYLVRNAGLKA